MLIFSIHYSVLLYCLLLAAIITLISGISKGISDEIAQHDGLADWGKWFSKKEYWESHYEFVERHPNWSYGWRRWIVDNVFIIFLDAWHFSQMLHQVCENILPCVPIFVLLSFWHNIALFITMFIVFQIGFRIIYNRPLKLFKF